MTFRLCLLHVVPQTGLPVVLGVVRQGWRSRGTEEGAAGEAGLWTGDSPDGNPSSLKGNFREHSRRLECGFGAQEVG